MKWIADIGESFTSIIFPQLCAGCGTDIQNPQQIICFSCMADLPETNFAMVDNNLVEKIFWGRIPVNAAMCAFYFSKHALMQELIHRLKYKGRKDIGIFLGRQTGRHLMNSHRFKNIDAIVPLPLFPDKEKKRGYNQATVIAEGISEIIEKPVLKNIVIRKRFTETQTKKGRTARWQNVEDSFEVIDQSLLIAKHILLVDDVVTTGATLEACGSAILKVEHTVLSIATLAMATK